MGTKAACLLSGLLLSLVAFATAPSALAQVEVSDENGVHCSTVMKVGSEVSGGCAVHLVNTVQACSSRRKPKTGPSRNRARHPRRSLSSK